MSVPPYFAKAAAGVAGAIGDITADDLQVRLDDVHIHLGIDERLAELPRHVLGFLTVVNLAARLYPNISIDAPRDLADRAMNVVRDINPDCTLDPAAAPTVRFRWGSPAEDADITVCARGWTAQVDTAVGELDDPTAPAALAAAALGVNEIFRTVFAAELATFGRIGPQPTTVNLVTLDDTHLPTGCIVDIGRAHLAGAGAIGQAVLLTLHEADVTGELIVVDPEQLDATNLQRYILSRVGDEGVDKVAVAIQRAGRDGLTIDGDPNAWNACHGADAANVLCGFDSAAARRALQASLPATIYNAYTSLDDIGWSRHEHFGIGPCLACLYWPTGPGPTRAEQVAAALGIEAMRATFYLIEPRTVSQPIDPTKGGNVNIAPDLRAAWTTRSILDDLAAAAGVERSELDHWNDRTIEDLYREGVCGGAFLSLTGGRPALVPLAHESLLAGVLLATQLIVACDEQLRALRPDDIEGRWNLRAGPAAVYTRRPAREARCICADPYFTAAFDARS